MGGIGEFEVSAAKAAASGASVSASVQPLVTGVEGAWRHFACVASPACGLSVPVHFNTLEMDVFRGFFRLRTPLRDWKLPDGLAFTEEVTFALGPEQVAHPERIAADQPLLAVLGAATQLLDQCLQRRLAQPEFLKTLNGLGLPLAWRNELANGVFSQVRQAGSETAFNPKDPVDALLASVGLAGSPEPATPAAEFIAEVGSSGTGFTLNEPVARGFRQGLGEFAGDLERGLLDHPAASAPLALALGLNRWLKRLRGPQRLHGHVLPAVLADAAFRDHWREALAEHPGEVEAWVLLTQGEKPDGTWAREWGNRLGNAALLLQAEEAEADSWMAWAAGRKAPTYVFAGAVAAAVGEGMFHRPAAMAYVEALAAGKVRLRDAAAESLSLEEGDMDPATHSPARRLYDGDSLRAARSRGLNVPVGARNRGDVLFLPLAAPPK